MTFFGIGIFLWCYGEDILVRLLVLMHDHPQLKNVQRSLLLIFLDGRLKGLSETFEGNQICTSAQVPMMIASI
jgi:hypothetical protein